MEATLSRNHCGWQPYSLLSHEVGLHEALVAELLFSPPAASEAYSAMRAITPLEKHESHLIKYEAIIQSIIAII